MKPLAGKLTFTVHKLPPRAEPRETKGVAMSKLKNNLRPCPVLGCSGHRKRDQVMCYRCWKQVPKDLALRVWRLFKNARGSEEHLAAMHEAVESVPPVKGVGARHEALGNAVGETSFEN